MKEKSIFTTAEFRAAIADQLIQNSEGFYHINLTDNTFTAIKSSVMLSRLFGDTGEYGLFLGRLLSGKPDLAISRLYESFLSRPFRVNDIYTRRIQVSLDGTPCDMNFLFFTKSETEAFLSLSRLDATFVAEDRMYEKNKALGQTYLFSMLVDLDDNACYNAHISEISLSGQDRSKMSYADWRKNLSNCIAPDFLASFLEKTDPDFIRIHLEKDNRFYFHLQMHVLDGRLLWTQHTLIRIRNEENDHLSFLYTVQDQDKEKNRLLQQLHARGKDQDTVTEVTASDEEIHISSGSNMILEQVEYELRTKYMNKLTLNKMAEKYYINPAYLGQLFIKKYGISFHGYLTSQRMEKAAALLTQTDYSIRRIIELVGISSSHYFNRIFKEYYKCTPTEYRNSQ